MSIERTPEETESRQRAAKEAAFIHTRIDFALSDAALLAVNWDTSEEAFVEAARQAWRDMSGGLLRRARQILEAAEAGGV